MEKKRMPLQHKIIFGYIILVAVIGSMIAILIYERRQMREVEGSVARLWRMYEDIHIAHRHVTGLALQGEAAAGWSDAERDKYHTHRMRTDSMLGVLGQRYSTIIPGGEIDTLRRFLAEKDTILVAIMETHREQWKRAAMGKRLAKDLPGAVKKATRRGSENPAVVEYLVDQIVTAYVKDSGVDHLAEVAPLYSAKVTDPAKKAKFDELCAKWARIAVGQPSPSFKYLDINGKEVSLADLAGKYVYIDTWATWCGPCRGELPHLKTLEEKYGKKNIYFVSISCDRDKAAWEKMVKEDKLGGIQLHNGGDNTFMDAYMITGIPRFILLDKEGKIINAKMTRPSNPETAKTFDALEGI